MILLSCEWQNPAAIMGIATKRNVMVDSNVFIHLLRHDRDPFLELSSWVDPMDLVTCGMVRLEVERGLTGNRLRIRTAKFFDLLRFIPATNIIWSDATEIAWTLDRQGKVLPAQDILIAAHCLKFGGQILTSDRHFESVHGLKVYKPEEELEGW